MASNIKQSKQRIQVLENHVWEGLQKGIKATDNKANVSEVIDVLLRMAQSFNSSNHKQNTSGKNPDGVIKIG